MYLLPLWLDGCACEALTQFVAYDISRLLPNQATFVTATDSLVIAPSHASRDGECLHKDRENSLAVVNLVEGSYEDDRNLPWTES
jgi:hypothetical protein